MTGKKTIRALTAAVLALLMTAGSTNFRQVQAADNNKRDKQANAVMYEYSDRAAYLNAMQAEADSIKAACSDADSRIDAIGKYIADTYDYGGYYTAFGMYKHGSGSCWASAEMAVQLAEDMGYTGQIRDARHEGGSGHRNALIYAGGSYYIIEAGFTGQKPRYYYTEKLSAQPYDTDVIKAADGTDGFDIKEEDTSTVGCMLGFMDETADVPSDPGITALGSENSSSYFSYGPFVYYRNLKTVKVHANITKIASNAFVCDGLAGSWKFEVDADNPNYMSDENGSLYEKNADGTKGAMVYTPCASMYRLYNPNTGEHFYTSSLNERDQVIAAGWQYENIGWNAPVKSNTPVYRLYNKNGGEHHYTMDPEEKDRLMQAGWSDEGIGWYSDDAETVPLYREYNPNAFANNHNYTVSKEENSNLLSLGWKYEGIGWYGYSAG